MTDSILRHNATCDRARERFIAKHGRPPIPDFRTADKMTERNEAFQQWRKDSGFDAFMRRVHSRSMRAQGFERCDDANGWRMA